jgi:hypothetical protein
MKKKTLTAMLIVITAPAFSAPPAELGSALNQWAAPRSVARYQFALVDLNDDKSLEVVVHVTDQSFCGNGGCPLVTFRRTATGYELVGSSGLVRKPVYVMNEVQGGWHTLAAVVGLGQHAGVVPIRFKEPQASYRSAPYMNAQIELTSRATKQALDFEEVPKL